MSDKPKYQACTYQSRKGARWRDGLAKVEEFGLSSVLFIVDAETGDRMKTVWDYRLAEGPAKHLFFGEIDA